MRLRVSYGRLTSTDRPQYATASHRQSYQSWQRVFDVGFRVVVEENSAAVALDQ